ncbi:MAG: hypothetical protein U0793_33530 [Gemmataceae bacterium]
MKTSTPKVEELALAKLSGRKIDVAGFVDELLDLVADLGEVRCSVAGSDFLRFDLPNGASCEVPLDACRGKLRMLCARMAALCNESGSSVSPYGGQGIVKRAGTNGTAFSQRSNEWKVIFMNTPDDHHFAICPAPARSAKPEKSPNV